MKFIASKVGSRAIEGGREQEQKKGRLFGEWEGEILNKKGREAWSFVGVDKREKDRSKFFLFS